MRESARRTVRCCKERLIIVIGSHCVFESEGEGKSVKVGIRVGINERG
jgi:hypothetical protein